MITLGTATRAREAFTASAVCKMCLLQALCPVVAIVENRLVLWPRGRLGYRACKNSVVAWSSTVGPANLTKIEILT